MQCAACGAALPPGETMSCATCGATLAIPSLREAYAAVEKLAPLLKANAGEAAARGRQAPSAPRSTPTCRAGASWSPAWRRRRGQRRGHGEPFDWSSLKERGTNPVRAVLIGVGIWLLWRFWR